MAYLYSRPERLADGAIHILGIAATIIAGTVLIVQAAHFMQPSNGAGDLVAISVYVGAALLTFVASALFHMTPWDHVRPWLQRVDHASIYLKIAGTYTPLVVLIGTGYAYVVLAVVWTVAVAGAVGKMMRWLQPGVFSTFLYLALGWASVALIWPLAMTVPALSLGLIIGGGLLYSVGAVFIHWETLRYYVAIWHGFVLSASACFFAAIAIAFGTQA